MENPQMLLQDSGDGWLQLQDAAENSVVQVIAQIAKYNWLEPYKVQEQGENRGTGFFIDKEGYIITNAHVVDEATKVWVHLPSLGRRSIFVDIVSLCPDRDLALLRVQKEELEFLRSAIGEIRPLPFGDSDLIQRTERVLVLGYPLGQHRMKSSTGVISGRESGEGRSLIQITAPINPGNSGGPLLNARGEIIGIAISMVFLAQNIGYAIPINELKIVLDDLYATRFVRRESLGARFNFATDDAARLLGNPLPVGFYVNKIFKNSLMERAGVVEGDMIYEFNGFRLDGYGDTTAPWSYEKIAVNDLVARLKIGDPVHLVIYRTGKRLDLHFNFDQSPPYPVRYMYPGYEAVEYEIIGGMVVMQLADNHLFPLLTSVPYLISYARTENKVDPVLVVTHIIPGSLAQQIHNLVPGFILKEVNGKAVGTMEQFRSAVRESVKSQFLTLKTADCIFSVLPFAQVLKDEHQLSKDFAYPISPFVQELLNNVE